MKVLTAITLIAGFGLILNLAIAQNTTTEEPTHSTRLTPTGSTRPPYLCDIDDPEPPPEGCPIEEEFPTYFPYPYDCRKYFQCAHGAAICMKCPNNTVWDQENTICDREAIGCRFPTTTPSYKQENGIIAFFRSFKFF